MEWSTITNVELEVVASWTFLPLLPAGIDVANRITVALLWVYHHVE